MILLTDGVFAIAITLLALELKAPPGWDGQVLTLFPLMRTSLLAFWFSFLVIAFYWVSHRRTFRHVQRCDGPLTVLNFVFLALITLLPFGTRLVIAYGGTGKPATGIYLGLIGSVGVASALLWGYASVRPGIMSVKVPTRLRVAYFLVTLLMGVGMVGLGTMASQPGSGWLWIVIAAILVVVGRVRRWVMKGLET
jgi:uncharacterized membrane protein